MSHARCPEHVGQWFSRSTGDCSCGGRHRGRSVTAERIALEIVRVRDGFSPTELSYPTASRHAEQVARYWDDTHEDAAFYARHTGEPHNVRVRVYTVRVR